MEARNSVALKDGEVRRVKDVAKSDVGKRFISVSERSCGNAGKAEFSTPRSDVARALLIESKPSVEGLITNSEESDEVVLREG